METAISSTTAFSGRIVSVRVDEVETPSGRRATREVVERPDTVSVLAVDDKGRVLFVRQYRYAVGRETLEIPAGTIDPGETPEEAARRELREETGYDCEELEPLITYYPAAGYSTEKMTIYLAKKLVPAPLVGDEESIKAEAVATEEACRILTEQPLVGADRGSVFHDGKTIIALLLAHSRGLL